MTDILQTKDIEKGGELKYSQSRVYLFISLLFLFGSITITLTTDTPLDKIRMTLDTLYYLILVFSGYALSSKATQHFSSVKDLKK